MSVTLDRILGLVQALTWVNSTQSYKVNGPPGSYSSAGIEISRSRLVFTADQEEEQRKLDEEVEVACQKRMGLVMHTLVEMIEEHTPE